MTVKKFMLKRFPTDEYMDCPVPKEYWDIIQEYAEAYAKSLQQTDVSGAVPLSEMDGKEVRVKFKVKKHQPKIYPEGNNLSF